MSITNIPPGHFKILYYASASDYTKKDFESLKAPLPVRELFNTLDKKYPGMKGKVLSSCLVTINLEYVDLETENEANDGESVVSGEQKVIKEGDEVAVLPPVSSG